LLVIKTPFSAECLAYLSKANSCIAAILGGLKKKLNKKTQTNKKQKHKTENHHLKTKLLNTTYREIPLNPLDSHALASQYTADAKLFSPVL